MAEPDSPAGGGTPGLTVHDLRARWLLLATVGASGMAFLDGTVVNVALPSIARSLDTDVAGLQWVLNGYLVTTSALILVGGALGDRLGRRRMFVTGVVLFAAASLACGLAPGVGALVGARLVQGVGGALLTPGSLALIQSSFRPEDRARAIGTWSGLTGVASAIGPFVGGWLVDAGSWRWVFLINLPLAAGVVVVTLRHVPESRDTGAEPRVDVSGAALVATALGGLSWGLIAAGDRGWADVAVVLSLVASAAAFAAFGVVEHRSSHPMLPPAIFASRQFTAANLVTVGVYAGLGTVFFLLVVQLQQVLGYSALAAGTATLPITALMLLLSSRSGQLAARIGPRLQMSAGPLLVAGGFVWMSGVGAGDRYLTGVLPPVLLVGVGLTTTVAPLTATALGAVADRYAGVASGANNAVARASQLAAVAAIPLAAGLTGGAFEDPQRFSEGFSTAMLIGAGVVAVGGAIGFLRVRNPAPAAEVPARVEALAGRVQCGVEGPALDRCPGSADPADPAA